MLWETSFSVGYVPYGGSGMQGLSWGAFLELDWDYVEWLVERMDEQRAKEAQAIRAANSTRK